MVESVTIFAISMPYFLAMIGIRIGVLRGIYLELQKKTQERADDAYQKFEGVIFAIKKKNRDPEQALDHAAQYFSFVRIGDDLNDMYSSNRNEMLKDFTGIAVSIIYVVIAYPHITYGFQSLIHFMILAGIGFISLIYFIDSMYQINQIEKKLGIGVLKHRFDFLNRK